MRLAAIHPQNAVEKAHREGRVCFGTQSTALASTTSSTNLKGVFQKDQPTTISSLVLDSLFTANG